MKKASVFLKQIITLLSSIAKAKTMAIKSKTSAAKARLVMFSLLKNKKVLMDTVSHKFHNLLGHHDKDSNQGDGDGDESRAIVLYNAIANEYSHAAGSSRLHTIEDEEEDDNDKYPDLRHCLFDEDENFDDIKAGVSVVDIVKNSRVEGEDFKLEDEIDQVADLFITRFHKQIRLQKLESFKRYKDMLERST
ncbi:uncharacterized protein LOC133710267 [Rosa rugosa]|uniref:Uncharacterized protein n=1 Tax=Rosa chinensis TaxID=74649 RepID=A0A2P6QZW9_ROSCH|nr:uncharacterized protein LOC112198170 [Rosa chinensis]XP_061992279.1 uncharacterized protein LOC133710267 [Rosa rugosa]PRQ39733.1 hypothetical protein RchiOBHm_Chr4g0428421 [Rosa chinensis]